MENAATARITAQPGDTEWDLRAEPGRTIGLLGTSGGGLTRVGLSMLVEASQRTPVAVVDVRGWISPLAAFEVGIRLERLVVVRTPDRQQWSQVVAALLEGLQAVYAEVPTGISDAHLRRLSALARARRGTLLLRPLDSRLPSGMSHLILQSERVVWDGAESGHGRLGRRNLQIRAWGKAVRGTERVLEVEDDGENAMRVVAGMVAPSAGRAAG